MLIRALLFAAIGVLAAPVAALAQAQPTGQFTAGHLLRATGPTGSPYADAGGAQNGSATELGITATGTPFAINDAKNTSPSASYHQLAFGANSLGGGLIGYNNYGTAPALPLLTIVNGVTVSSAAASGLSLFGDPTAPTAPPNDSSTLIADTQFVQEAIAGLTVFGAPIVANLAVLQSVRTSQYPGGVWRTDYGTGVGAPPLFYRPLVGTCAANGLTNDGGSCVNTTAGDNNSWAAKFPSGYLDIRQWGAKPDNTTPADAAVAAAGVYAGLTNGCAYAPNVAPGFRLNNPITLTNNWGCFVGDRIENYNINTGVIGSGILNFPNDSDGIVLNAAPLGFYVANLSMVGNGAASASATHTHGLYINGSYDGVIENIYIQNFVICKQYTAPSGRVHITNATCFDKYSYPNIVNGYPLVGFEMDSSGGAVVGNGLIETGGEMGAQSAADSATYTGNSSQTWFQICAPHTGTISGFGETCSGAPVEPASFLWMAKGIRVRLGANQTLPNSQPEVNAPLAKCGYSGQTASYDYDIYDISASGGSGTGGVHLFCTQTPATLVAGSATVTVASTTQYKFGTNIVALADFGIPPGTTVVSIINSTQLALSQAATQSGVASMTLTQAAVSTSGPGGSPPYSQGCQATNACGYKMEVRFVSAPSAEPVSVLWYDPTGYAGYYIAGGGDGIVLRPNFIGGYQTGIKHTGVSYSWVDLLPAYIELVDQCASVEAQTGGDTLVFNRVTNPPIPFCPGYIDPLAGATITAFNKKFSYYNGASPGNSTVPGYISSYWYAPHPAMLIDAGSAVGAQNTIYCHPMIMGAPFTIKQMGSSISSAGTSAQVEYGFYSNDAGTNRPGKLLAASPSATTISGAGVALSGVLTGPANSPVYVGVPPGYTGSPGTYWGCSLWAWSGAPHALSVALTGSTGGPLFSGAMIGSTGSAGPFGNNNTGASYTTSGLFAAGFPASLTALTTDSSAIPAVQWQEN